MERGSSQSQPQFGKEEDEGDIRRFSKSNWVQRREPSVLEGLPAKPMQQVGQVGIKRVFRSNYFIPTKKIIKLV